MTDLGITIAPKSDQLNADDLIAGPITITITRVSAGSSEQPISINFENDQGKPYKPGKSMRRVLVHQWGRDGSVYVGRSLTLYRDPEVQFGGMAVGGIRISHMSHISGERSMPLTNKRGSKKLFTVQPLRTQQNAGASRAPASDPGHASPTLLPGSDTFPGDRIVYEDRRLDPAQPCKLVPGVPVSEMEPPEAIAYCTALAGLMKAAPERARDWFDLNRDEILRIKARWPNYAGRLEEYSNTAAPPRSADAGASSSAVERAGLDDASASHPEAR